MFDSLLPTITGGGSLIALILLWFADYLEFIEAKIDTFTNSSAL